MPEQVASIRLLFTSRKVLGSWRIRRFTWSDWSHVAVERGGKVIEAVALKGVVHRKLSDTLKGTDEHRFAKVLGPIDERRAWNFGLDQVGKPYDYKSLVGLFFRRDWQQEDAWQCAELVTAILLAGGSRPLRVEALNRVVPQHLYMSPLIELL